MKLNLGAGEEFSHARARAWPEWIDVDVRASTKPSVVADIRRLPFADGSAEYVYAGHVLEHLVVLDVVEALFECWRVLRRGGAILVVGPDTVKSVALHALGRIDDERLASNRAHGDPGDPCVHQWDCYAGQVMVFLFRAGFVNVREEPMGHGITQSPHWPIFDRVTPDQFAVVAHKP